MTNQERIEKAFSSGDHMAAYELFLTQLEPISVSAMKLLPDSIDAVTDWVKDQFLDLAVNKIHTIRHPQAWKTFLYTAIKNRARSFARQNRLISSDLHYLISESEVIETDESLSLDTKIIFRNISLRDRALLKLSYGIEPSKTEWAAIAIVSGLKVCEIIDELSSFVFKLEQLDAAVSRKLIKTYGKLIFLERKQQYFLNRLDWLYMQNPPDEQAIQKTDVDLRISMESWRSQYRKFHRLQNQRGHRISAKTISKITGIGENTIHQVTSRARRKILENIQ